MIGAFARCLQRWASNFNPVPFVPAGRRIRIGMCSIEAAGAMESKKAVIR
jgi:hypothetical protein